VSRGRRKLMVPFKTAPFAYSSFFFWNSARNGVLLPKTRRFI
jgi:hypothetical protein